MTKEGHKQAIDYVNTAAAGGWLQHHIGQTLPLESVAEAHELIERGSAGGKVLLTLD